MTTKTVTFRPHSPLGLLGVLFVILKLTHVVAWSWVWVLAPFWAFALMVVGVLVTFSIMAAWEKR